MSEVRKSAQHPDEKVSNVHEKVSDMEEKVKTVEEKFSKEFAIMYKDKTEMLKWMDYKQTNKQKQPTVHHQNIRGNMRKDC